MAEETKIRCPVCGSAVSASTHVKEHRHGTIQCYGSHMPVFDYGESQRAKSHGIYEGGPVMYIGLKRRDL